MKAMVLAAGLGTRLAPLTQQIPKPLIPLNGQPLITYTLRYLKFFGITDIYLNLHHLGSQIKERLGDGGKYGVRITYSEEPEILGTGGGIKKLETELGKAPFLVINSDILTDFDLRRLFLFHQEKKGLVSLVLREDPMADLYGAIEIDSSGLIRTILGKGTRGTLPLKKLMFTGIHLMDPAVLKKIPAGVFHSVTDTFITLVSEGQKLYGLETNSFWEDLGTLEKYDKINQSMRRGEISLSYL